MKLKFRWGPLPYIPLDPNILSDKINLDKLDKGNTITMTTLVYSQQQLKYFKDEFLILTSGNLGGYLGTVNSITLLGHRTEFSFIPNGKVFVGLRFAEKKSGMNFAYLTFYKNL